MSKAKNIKPKVIEDSDEDSDSSIPIIATKTTKKEKIEEKKVVKKVVKQESSEEEDTPIVEKKPVKQLKTQTVAAKKVIPSKKPAKQPSSQEQSEEEAPKKTQVKVKSPVQKPVVTKKKVQESSEEQSEEEAPKPVVKAAKVVQKVASPVQKPVQKVTKKPAKVEDSDEESEEQKPVAKAVKSPVQKIKSPVQKAVVNKKKVEESEEQSEEEVKPVKKAVAKVAAKKPKSQSQQEEEPKIVVKKAAQKAQKKPEPIEEESADEEGAFQVCVRGLSFQAYDSDIRSFFDNCGNVSEVKLLTRDDGKSKGTAFVKFTKKSSFNKALELSGSEHMGRSLTIEESQGKKPFNNDGGQRGGNSKPYGSNQYPQSSNVVIETPTLFIGGISYNSTAESIKDFFASAGPVASARVVTDRESGKPRGFGYVEFYDVETAQKAYQELNGGNLDGRTIRLDKATQRDKPQGGFGGGQGGYGGNQGGFSRGGPSRNPGNSTVNLSQDDKNAKKGSIGNFAGKKVTF